jgi:hypothetical protein
MSAYAGRRLALTGAVLLLGALVWLNLSISSMTIDVSPLAPDVPPRLASPVDAPAERAIRAEPDLSQTLLRPIFSPTRKDFVASSEPEEAPPAPAVTEDTEAAAMPAPLDFKGTRVLKGRFAALVSTGDGEAQWYEQGAIVGGWTIKSIFADRLFIIANEHTEVLSLYGSDPPAPDDSTQQ